MSGRTQPTPRGLLADRRALITGGASGIGAATATRFCEEGASVCLADLDGSGVEAVAGELSEAGFRAVALQVDVTREADVQRAVKGAETQLGGLDTVIANAGVLELGDVEDTASESFSRVLAVNVLGVFHLFKLAIRPLRDSGQGVMLATGSLASFEGSAQLAGYCASKFAVVGLIEALAQEVASDGIRVCGVAPGMVDSPMLPEFIDRRAELTATSREEVAEGMLKSIALGRTATTVEIADAFVLLASPLAGYVTGEVLRVDGGFQ